MQNVFLDIKDYTFAHMKSMHIPYSKLKLTNKYIT